MPGGQAGRADYMNIIFDCHPGGLLGGLKHGADIHVKSKIGKSGGNDFNTPIMTILAYFGDQDSRAPAFVFLKFGRTLANRIDNLTVTVFGSIHTGNALGGSHETPECFFKGI